MSNDVIEKDSEITLPHFCILKASAGSGKTHTLTKRYVQFLLSSSIPNNSLRNMLAITFSNNAAMEMKERVLGWLKALYWEDPGKTAEIMEILSGSETGLNSRAETLIDSIFENYSDFQIKTIDSFMAAIFKASSIEFGYPPDFEILLNSSQLTVYAFDLYLRGVSEGSMEAELLDEAITTINTNRGRDSSFIWNPSRPLLEEIININRKCVTPSFAYFQMVEEELGAVKEELRDSITALNSFIAKACLERTKRDPVRKMSECAAEGRFADLAGMGMKQMPVKKPSRKRADLLNLYVQVQNDWEAISGLVSRYALLYSRSYYFPYFKVLASFTPFLEGVKKSEGKIFIEDVTYKLSEFITSSVVPDIYFQIGETIYHYLIDEFQDTSPVQWSNLMPLVENPISQGGTLFAVGDTKQAIYLFRDADYKIMKGFETSNPFPSAAHMCRELNTNYRSLPAIIAFNERLFKESVPECGYGKFARLSGLSEFSQKASGKNGASGYVEVSVYEKDPELLPEKERVKMIVDDLIRRGYRYGDLAVLTGRNDAVSRVSGWLDDFSFPFVSHSSLDIRKRRIIAELLALLRFLNSPVDDYSFSLFCLGKIMKRTLSGAGNFDSFLFRSRSRSPKYKVFKEEYETVWGRYFEKLFKVAGHFPPYDLLVEVYRSFDLFNLFRDEEAALVRLLELLKEFEDAGTNTLMDFLKASSSEKSDELDWNLNLPTDVDAIQVMTVHKSKGLGFPVVIALLYGETSKGFDYIAERGEKQTNLLKITGKLAGSNSRLHELYEAEKEGVRVSGLNTLYVAFTRPESELYVIGVRGERDTLPFDVLSKVSAPVGEKNQNVETTKKTTPLQAEIYHPGYSGVTVPAKAGSGINVLEMERGEAFHRVICEVEFFDEHLEKRLEDAIVEVMGEDSGGIKKLLVSFITSGEIKPLFVLKPGRTIEREKEYVNRRGDLLRMDRVVVDSGSVTVIDFKTGTEYAGSEKYIVQVRRYMDVLSEIFPQKVVSGLVTNIDTLSSRWIK